MVTQYLKANRYYGDSVSLYLKASSLCGDSLTEYLKANLGIQPSNT